MPVPSGHLRRTITPVPDCDQCQWAPDRAVRHVTGDVFAAPTRIPRSRPASGAYASNSQSDRPTLAPILNIGRAATVAVRQWWPGSTDRAGRSLLQFSPSVGQGAELSFCHLRRPPWYPALRAIAVARLPCGKRRQSGDSMFLYCSRGYDSLRLCPNPA